MQKRLTKSTDKCVAGVLGGIAEYFGWDPAWTRIGGSMLMLLSGWGVIVYIAAACVMPEKSCHDDVPNGHYRRQ